MTPTLTTADGLPLHLHDWPRPGAARGTVLIVHGLGEHIGRYAHVAAQLNAAGWHVAGLRPPRPRPQRAARAARIASDDACCADLALVIDAARAGAPGPLVLLGHSMGGLVAARFVAEGLQRRAGAPGSATVDGAGAVVARARRRHERRSQKLLLAVLGPLAPNLAVANGLKPGLGLARPGRRARPTWPTRWCTTASRRGWRASSSTAASWCAASRRAGGVPTLLLWAGADRCVAPPAAPPSPRRRRKAVLQAQAFEPLFHEIFNEPEQAQVFAACRPGCSAAAEHAFYTRAPPSPGARHERPRPAAAAAARRSHRARRLRRRGPGTSEIVPALTDYIAIPAKSPMFDADWADATATSTAWCATPRAWVESQKVAGPEARGGAPRRPHAGDLLRGAGHQGRAAPTPCCCTATSTSSPSSTAGATTSARGRRSTRTACSTAAAAPTTATRSTPSITAIEALDAQGIPRPRCVGLIESCEESGSFDLPAYIDALQPAPGQRGPGRVPGQRRRQLRPALADHQPARHGQRRAEGRDPDRRHALGRRERPGAVELSHPAPGARPARGFARPATCCRRASTARSRPIASSRRAPPRRSSATRSGSASPGPAAPTAAPTLPTTTDPVEALLNRTWRPTLSVTGVDGFPELKNAGNVLRPYTAFKLSACACRRWSTATRPRRS